MSVPPQARPTQHRKETRMPSMNLSVPHQLSKAEAKQRVQNLIGQLQQQYAGIVKNVREEWNGDRSDFSFEAMGFAISGSLFVEDALLRLESNLPMAALPFKGRIENAIKENA